MFQAAFAAGAVLAAVTAIWGRGRWVRPMLVIAVCLIIFSQAPGIAAWLGS